MRRLLIGALIALLSLALAACEGDGDDRAETINPTAAVTSRGAAPPAAAPQTPAAQTLVPDLTKALLTLDDMPTGWSVRADVPPPSDALVCDKRLPRFRDQAADFQRADFERGNANVSNIVSRYRPGEAQSLLEALKSLYESCPQWTQQDGSTSLTLRAAALAFPKLGDQTFAIRLTATSGALTAQSDQVTVRRGDVLTTVTYAVAGLGSLSADPELTERLVRRADERLATVPMVPPGASPSPAPVARQATPTPQPTQPLKIAAQGFGSGVGLSARTVGWAFIVENPNQSDAAERTSYQIAFYDQAGVVVKTEQNYIELLYPGERRGVGGSTFLGEGQTVARMDVQIKADRFRRSDQKQPFTAEGVAFRPDRFSPKVVGIIRSATDKDVKSVFVSAVAYDGAGTIIGGGFTFVDFVPANGQAAVEVSVAATAEPARVELCPAPSVLSSLN